MEEKKNLSERERLKQALDIRSERIAIFSRLKKNSDFEIYVQDLLDEPIERLRDLLESAEGNELYRIRGALEALRGIKAKFELTLEQKDRVDKEIKNLG